MHQLVQQHPTRPSASHQALPGWACPIHSRLAAASRRCTAHNEHCSSSSTHWLRRRRSGKALGPCLDTTPQHLWSPRQPPSSVCAARLSSSQSASSAHKFASPQGNLVKLQDFLDSQQQAANTRSQRPGQASALDLQRTCNAFMGWTVIDTHHQESIGKVAQLETVDPEEEDEQEDEDEAAASHTTPDVVIVMLCVHKPSTVQHQGGVWHGVEVHRIPVTPALIPWVDPTSRTLLATLPQGFLELGQNQVRIEFLSEALRPYAQPAHKSRALTPAALSRMRHGKEQQRESSSDDDDEEEEEEVSLVMPTSAALEAADRRDLMGIVKQAGGHAAVAAALGWTFPRRPRGYWDDPANLDAELNAFIATAWLEMPNESGPGTYYYNQISGAVMTQSPWSSSASNQQQAGARYASRQGADPPHIMPTMSQMLDAGRSDLKFAINKFGGISAVADLLGRQLASTRRSVQHLVQDDAALLSELQALIEELGLPVGYMPTCAQLMDAGRHDLARVINMRGGWNKAAGKLGLKNRRRRGSELLAVDAAACLLMEFMISEIRKRCETLRKTADAQAAAAAGAGGGLQESDEMRPSRVQGLLKKLKNRIKSDPSSDGLQLAESSRRGGGGIACNLVRLQAELATAFNELAQAQADTSAAVQAVHPAGLAERNGWGVPVWLTKSIPMLPSVYALTAARRYDLCHAIRVHGRGALEERCGLVRLRGGAAVKYHRQFKTSVPPCTVSAVIAERLALHDTSSSTPGQQQGQQAQEMQQDSGQAQGAGAGGGGGGGVSSFTRGQLHRELQQAGLPVTRTQVQIAVDKLLQQGLVVRDQIRKHTLHVVRLKKAGQGAEEQVDGEVGRVGVVQEEQ